jgi:branched-chain amino acid transport system ATP-binding protein
MSQRPSPKLVEIPSNTFFREEDVGKMPVLDTRNLGIDFGGLTAVDNFSMAIGPTEIAGLIGPNGAGKTTIFNLLTNVYQPTRGSILLKGVDTKGKTTAQVNRMGIARTFQNIRLFSAMSALDNVKVGLHNEIKCSFASSLLRLPSYFKSEREANEKAMELLDFLGLADIADKKAGSLPYGVQRRLEIVRALATNPAILLLDEPAAGMNPSETAELMNQILMIRDNFHIAVMLIEHDMNLVMGVCEGIVVVNYGKIIAKGTPDQIRSNPTVIEAYLGKKDGNDI